LVFKSDCGKGGDWIETTDCSEVEIGTSVEFRIEVRASRCIQGPVQVIIP
jgi:hypothetical protein